MEDWVIEEEDSPLDKMATKEEEEPVKEVLDSEVSEFAKLFLRIATEEYPELLDKCENKERFVATVRTVGNSMRGALLQKHISLYVKLILEHNVIFDMPEVMPVTPVLKLTNDMLRIDRSKPVAAPARKCPPAMMPEISRCFACSLRG